MKPETKVGVLFIITFVLIAAFGYFLGAFNPFSNTQELNLAYNYAGGIEVGSPIRVMGIKVGKVKSIDFKPDQKMPNGEEVKLLVRISIKKKAWKTIRKDSQFFINLAGVIGEKFIEVSPGSTDQEEFTPGDLVRGEDPPRVDQLISQSYGLAGKIIEFVEKNEGSVIDTINMMNSLVTNLNGLLKQVNELSKNGQNKDLIQNISTLTRDLAYFSQKMRSKEGEETFKLMKELIWRLKSLDGKQIRKFLQEEGIKAKMF